MAELIAVDGDPFKASAGPQLVPVDGNPFEVKKAEKKQAPEKPQRSTGSELKRQVGLTTRAGVAGVAALPAMFGNALNATLNLGIDAVNNNVGTSIPRFKPVSAAVQDVLDASGLPQPENATERVVQDVTSGMAGAAGTAALSQSLAKVTPEVAREIVKQLGQRAGTQAASAGTAAGSAGIVRENEGGPLAQITAALAGGMATPALGYVAQATPRTVKSFIQPFTEEGRKQIVGNSLAKLSTNPKQVLERLQNFEEVVPGSMPTTAQAGRDTGLLVTERSMASTNPLFSQRQVANNAARNALLDEVAGDASKIDFFKTNREVAGNQLYKEAFTQSIDPQSITPSLKGEVSKLLTRPSMKNAVKEARLRAAEEGIKLNDKTSIQGLHYAKMALDDQISVAQRAGKSTTALMGTKNKLLDVMEKLSPAYSEARTTYAEMSKPINQMELMQSLRQRATLPGTDVAGNPVLSQAKYQNALTRALPEAQQVLEPAQLNALARIADDLDMAQLSQSAGRAAGSNTYQSLTTGNVLTAMLKGDIPNSPFLDTVMRPLGWLYKLPEKAAQELLTQAMLDPRTAALLMAKATPESSAKVGAILAERLRAMGYGAALGSSFQTQPLE